MSDSSWDTFAVIAHSRLWDLCVGVTSCAVKWTETRVPCQSLAIGLYIHTITWRVLPLKSLQLHILLFSFCEFLKTGVIDEEKKSKYLILISFPVCLLCRWEFLIWWKGKPSIYRDQQWKQIYSSCLNPFYASSYLITGILLWRIWTRLWASPL